MFFTSDAVSANPKGFAPKGGAIMKQHLVAAISALFAVSLLNAQQEDSVAFKQRSITMNGEEYKYALYIPEGKKPEAGWPLIVFLHGAGERGSDGVKQTTVGIGPAIKAHPERFGCLVLMPQCRKGYWWTGSNMPEMMLAQLDTVLSEFSIDKNRVSLTGLSLGGYGTWMIGAKKIERFSALGPVCGGGNKEDAPLLSHLPIWCFHGGADNVVPPRKSREMVEAVKNCGGDVHYKEYPGVHHNSWDNAYGTAEFIAWLQEKKRPPKPALLSEPLFIRGTLDSWDLKDNAAEHWTVDRQRDGTPVLAYDGGGNSLWTKKTYRNFLLKVKWRLPEKGDSGIYLRGNSKSQVNIWCNDLGSGEVWGYRTDKNLPEAIRKAVTPLKNADNPVGEWNAFVIRMIDDRLTVELNGTTVIDNAQLPGVPDEGPIALQHHGDPIEFKEISILPLPENGTALFNGKDLTGWKEVGSKEGTWAVKDGVLCCSGKPTGYIRTQAHFAEPYILTGQWRLLKPGQSGLLLHQSPPDRVWPPSIEVQLDHGVFGNFIKIGPVSYNGGKRIMDVEKPVGGWNSFMAVARNGSIDIFMNGRRISRATSCSPRKGYIGFQSEGVPTEFRNIILYKE